MLGEVQMNETIILLILLAVVVFVFFYLIWEINVCLNTFIYARQKKKMFKSLENILLSYYNKKDTSACFEEINLADSLFSSGLDLAKILYYNRHDIVPLGYASGKIFS